MRNYLRRYVYLSDRCLVAVGGDLGGGPFAPGLSEIEVGNDDAVFKFSAVERIFVAINVPRGCENPQRQGIESALIDGRRPRNVLRQFLRLPPITALCVI